MFADTIKKIASNNKFTRNKTDIIPNVIDLFSEKQKLMYFYVEFYNASKFFTTDNILAKYFITRDSVVVDEIQKMLSIKPMPVNFIEGSLDISSLKEGEYQLLVELYNKKNQKLATKKVSFLKLGLISGMDKQQQFSEIFKNSKSSDLLQYLDYHSNIAIGAELPELHKTRESKDSIQIIEYMYKFWLTRNPDNPTREWLTYLRKIEDANRMFSTALQKGYLTARGRVYVEYGPPNNVVESSDNSIAYPYQIWHYYKLTYSQSNKKFVFFNQTGALDEYDLIHSNATGEISNPNWQSIITKFNTKTNSGNTRSTFGDFLEKDFNE
jgi:GWxTD domain-containing protein